MTEKKCGILGLICSFNSIRPDIRFLIFPNICPYIRYLADYWIQYLDLPDNQMLNECATLWYIWDFLWGICYNYIISITAHLQYAQEDLSIYMLWVYYQEGTRILWQTVYNICYNNNVFFMLIQCEPLWYSYRITVLSI